MQEFRDIIYEESGYLSTITLNRPAKLNTLTDVMMREIREALNLANQNESIRVIRMRGAGRAFSAGFDVSADNGVRETPAQWKAHFQNGNHTFRAIWNSSKPVIAQLHGYCLGGAFDMMLACDLAICSENTKLGEPEVLWGGTSMFMLLPWVVGLKSCKKILLTGENMPAEEAFRLNIVNEVVPAELLESRVLKLCKNMATLPLGTLGLNKALINRVYEIMGISEAIYASEETAIFSLLSKEGEALEFDKMVEKVGMREALKWRNSRFE